jgi:hypothetical protein
VNSRVLLLDHADITRANTTVWAKGQPVSSWLVRYASRSPLLAHCGENECTLLFLPTNGRVELRQRLLDVTVEMCMKFTVRP